MKKFLPSIGKLIFLISFSTMLFSCNGKVKKSYYDNGNLRSELRYENEMLHGHCVWYHENGRVQMESDYVMNALNGKKTSYYENGVLESVTWYKNNLRDSLSEQYSINGKLILIENYKNDSLHGIFQRFYERGQMMVDGQFTHGWMQGEWLFYDTNGNIVGRASFEKGTGLQKGFHPNGRLSRVIHYLDNERHGAEEYYNLAGQLEMIRHYNMGVLVGEEIIQSE